MLPTLEPPAPDSDLQPPAPPSVEHPQTLDPPSSQASANEILEENARVCLSWGLPPQPWESPGEILERFLAQRGTQSGLHHLPPVAFPAAISALVELACCYQGADLMLHQLHYLLPPWMDDFSSVGSDPYLLPEAGGDSEGSLEHEGALWAEEY